VTEVADFTVTPAETVVLRHALMSYRNGIAERNANNPPYPMTDGFELAVADELIRRLDEESGRRLILDRRRSMKAADLPGLQVER
jgi:hypothetical protein